MNVIILIKFTKLYPNLKNKKLKNNIILIKKSKSVKENPDFEQIFKSRSSQDV